MMYICTKDGKRVKIDSIQAPSGSILSTINLKPDLDDQEVDDDASNDSYESDFSLASSSNHTAHNDDSGPGEKVKRKRQRLTHLSHEEKLMRRKLKNRVAAQSARDRKKAKMDELDVSVKQLLEQNEKLRLENGLLKEQKRLLSNENKQLKQKLNITTTTVNLSSAMKPSSCSVKVEAGRSAVSPLITQPKELLQQPLGNSNSNIVSSSSSRSALLMQRLLYVLIVQTLSLLKSVSPQSPLYVQLVFMKNSLIQLDQQRKALRSSTTHTSRSVKLKLALLKLLNLMRQIRSRRSQLQATLAPTPILSSALVIKRHQHQPQLPLSSMSSEQMKLCILISFVVKALSSTARK